MLDTSDTDEKVAILSVLELFKALVMPDVDGVDVIEPCELAVVPAMTTVVRLASCVWEPEDTVGCGRAVVSGMTCVLWLAACVLKAVDAVKENTDVVRLS